MAVCYIQQLEADQVRKKRIRSPISPIENRRMVNELLIIPRGLYTPHPDLYIFPLRYNQWMSNEKAFIPQMVSIGPFHHGFNPLPDMEPLKWRFLDRFISDTQIDLLEYIRLVRDRENRIRDCYSFYFNICSDHFVSLILLDSVFIIVLMLMAQFHPEELELKYDIDSRKLDLMVHDLLVTDNQIPFFIIEDIYDRARMNLYDPQNMSITLKETCYTFFFGNALNFIQINDIKEIVSSNVVHLLDLVRNCYIPLKPQQNEISREVFRLRFAFTTPTVHDIPSVTKLYQVGVRLEARLGYNLFDIKFEDGTLKIPKLKFEKCSKILNPNLFTYEQQHSCRHSPSMVDYLCSFFVLIGGLVKSCDDIDLLVQYGILEHHEYDNDGLLEKINYQSRFSKYRKKFYFATLCEELQEYCISKSHRRLKSLKRRIKRK